MRDAPTAEAIGSGLSDQEAAARLQADDLAVTVAAGLATILILGFLKPHWRNRLLT